MPDTAGRPGPAEIAIIGIGCRVPGADSPAELWRLLQERRDEITTVPRNRPHFSEALEAVGDRAPGAHWGGFLPDVERWDPAFFGISPAEARQMDPQQALALEVAWRALENAGIVPGSLGGSRTGVFFGQATHDHAVLLGRGSPSEVAGPFTNPGLSHAITANRLSYLWDLRGPSLAVDSACSSSLLAVHLAVQSLLLGECDLALAGGVNALLSPVAQLGAAGLTALAPDGRCRTFDAAGKGYVRSEGAGALVLRRLDEALSAEDPIHAVISATSVNQDGRTNGLTAPSGRAQTELIVDALRRAGIAAAEELGYVELHGTGTPLGDPIEARALAGALDTVFGNDRPQLAVGSIKANIGHLEAAAGVLGLIKAALVLDHGIIPVNPHFHEINPRIDLNTFRMRVPTESLALPGHAQAAAVSSFGFGGTNASAVLVRAPHRPPVRGGARASTDSVLLTLSARDERALADTAHQWAQLARECGSWEEIRDAARAAVRHRTHFEWRCAIVAADRDELVEKLEHAAAQGHFARCVPVTEGVLGFFYSGHGSQWEGMGRELLRTSPGFERKVQQVDATMAPLLGWSPLDALRGGAAADLDDIGVAQPLIMTVQLGLTEALADLGIRPGAVVGHSMGEVSAAVVAGKLELATACRVLRARNDAVEAARGTGGMAVVEAAADEARAILLRMKSPVTVAADNSPRSCVISGPSDELTRAMSEFESLGRDARLIKVDYPSHSPLMQSPAQQLERVLGEVERPRNPSAAPVTFYSSVHGRPLRDHLDAAYWRDNLTHPVRAQEAVLAMADDGVTHFLEISPHPVSLVALRECLQGRAEPVAALATGGRDRPALHGLHPVAAQLYEHGREPTANADASSRRWAPLLPGHPFRRTDVYRYPAPDGDSTPPAGPGNLVEVAVQPGTFVGAIKLPSTRTDHFVAGSPAASASELVSLACWAAEQAGMGEAHCVRDLDMRCVLPADPRVRSQLTLIRAGDGAEPSSALVSFLFQEAGRWLTAASCTVSSHSEAGALPTRSAVVRVDVTLPVSRAPATTGYGASLLDPALPAVAERLFASHGGLPELKEFTVSRIASVHVEPRLWTAGGGTAYGWLHEEEGGVGIDLTLVDTTGELLAQIQGIALRHLSRLPGNGDSPEQEEPLGGEGEEQTRELRRALAEASDDESRRSMICAYIRAALRSILPGGLPGSVPDKRPFVELGLESLMGVELRNRLEAGLGLRLSVALVWAHPTISDLSAALVGLLRAQAPPATREARGPAPDERGDSGEQASQDALTQLLAELDSTS